MVLIGMAAAFSARMIPKHSQYALHRFPYRVTELEDNEVNTVRSLGWGHRTGRTEIAGIQSEPLAASPVLSLRPHGGELSTTRLSYDRS